LVLGGTGKGRDPRRIDRCRFYRDRRCPVRFSCCRCFAEAGHATAVATLGRHGDHFDGRDGRLIIVAAAKGDRGERRDPCLRDKSGYPYVDRQTEQGLTLSAAADRERSTRGGGVTYG